MCGKNHCQFVFLRSGKNQTCVAFIKHIPNTNVCGKSHTCVLKDKHVCLFPYKRWYFLYLQLYFVFFKRIYYIISPSFILDVTMQSVSHVRSQKHLQISLGRNQLFGNSHTCVEKTTQVKNKNSKNNIKTNKFFMWAPPQLKDSL